MASARAVSPGQRGNGDGPICDLVLEGGGVKGIALVGALQPLAGAGYRFNRVGGSSAGAVVAAVLAALQQAGEPLSRLRDIAESLDYSRFRDRSPVRRALGPVGVLADAVAVLFEHGAYSGQYLHDWVSGVLSDLGVRTFADLRFTDPGADPAAARPGLTADNGGEHAHALYRLVVTASDLSRKKLLYLPWDYADYGLDPDEQLVADAVRASSSIPYFFEPVELRGVHGTSTLVDGGLLSNYPIEMFDRTDGKPPRWPTIGVRLDAFGFSEEHSVRPVSDPLRMGIALIETSIEACQAESVLKPCNLARSIFVDTRGVGAVDFGITRAEQEDLLQRGERAGREFADIFDFAQWLRECR